MHSYLFLVLLISTSLVSSAALPNALKKPRINFFLGQSTYYEVGPGSCGEYDNNSELVVALNKDQMNNGKGKKKSIHQCFKIK